MDPRIERLMAFIDTHLQTAMTVPRLAAHAGLSVSQLTRVFRRETGTTPTAYVNRLRLRRARALIERTSLPVSEVMAQVGISDPSHFARDFRRAYGLSPRRFREHLRDAPFSEAAPGAGNRLTCAEIRPLPEASPSERIGYGPREAVRSSAHAPATASDASDPFRHGSQSCSNAPQQTDETKTLNLTVPGTRRRW